MPYLPQRSSFHSWRLYCTRRWSLDCAELMGNVRKIRIPIWRCETLRVIFACCIQTEHLPSELHLGQSTCAVWSLHERFCKWASCSVNWNCEKQAVTWNPAIWVPVALSFWVFTMVTLSVPFYDFWGAFGHKFHTARHVCLQLWKLYACVLISVFTPAYVLAWHYLVDGKYTVPG